MLKTIKIALIVGLSLFFASPTYADPPANDDCINAENIADVNDLSFTTVNATFDGPGACITSPNIWYLYTASSTGQVLVTTCGTDEGATMLAVYDGATCPEFAESPTPIELQAGDRIETAIPINDPLPVIYTGTTECYTEDYTVSQLCCYYTSSPDVVYSYSPDSNGTINIDVEGSRGLGPVISILDSEGNELECDAGTGSPDGITQILEFPVTAGETYYFKITGYWGSVGDYSIKISSPDYTILGCNDVYWGASQIIFDAVAGNQYLIEVGISGSTAIENGVISVGPPPPAPENDDCANATPGGVLVPGTPIQFTGDNTGATEDYCITSTEINAPAVWITFTTQVTMDVYVDYCDNPTWFSHFYSTLFSACPCDNEFPYTSYDNFLYCSLHITPYWLDLPPGTYWYPIATGCAAQGPYIINVTGYQVQVCDDDALYGQIPTVPDPENNVFFESDIEDGHAVADAFSGVSDGIDQITWWGIGVDTENDTSCVINPSPFQIVFYESNPDEPYIPGDTAAAFNVEATPQFTGYKVYNNLIQFPQIKYIADLDSVVSLTDGWVLIKARGLDDCSFLWQNSLDGDSDGLQYNYLSNQWSFTNSSFAFCLGHEMSGIDDNPVSLPSSVKLYQNYPNPFNATTSIKFSLAETGEVALKIYDILGREIKTLYSGTLTIGTYNFIWNGTNESGERVSSGVYFYYLSGPGGTEGKSMVLLK